MIGNQMRVTLKDGTEQLVTITLWAATQFETEYKIGLIKAMTEEQKLTHMAYLAYACVKDSGQPVKLFSDWLKGVANVAYVFESATDGPGKGDTA